MKKNFFRFMVLALFFTAYATAKPELATAQVSVQDDLDMAIRKASDYINENVPGGIKLVILNIKSNYPPLSEYIVDVLTGNLVNDRVFTVVDRANLEQIQQEMEFQLSGEVSDESAQSIGQKLGAQTIVTGSITPFGNLWRLTIRALGVEGATVQGLFNQNISNGASIAALTTDGPVTAAAPRRTANIQQPASPTPPPVPAISQIEISTWDLKIQWGTDNRWFAILVIEKVSNNSFGNAFDGYFEWYRSGALVGREYFSGMYTLSSKKVNMQGTKVENMNAFGVRLGLDTYEAFLSEDGNSFTRGTVPGGTWEAVKQTHR
jgi:hypothetical protein